MYTLLKISALNSALISQSREFDAKKIFSVKIINFPFEKAEQSDGYQGANNGMLYAVSRLC